MHACHRNEIEVVSADGVKEEKTFYEENTF
jgi:hypothetical protein